jgi:alkylhydroperoxidase/carboxymuconolactone decarboxylase family protein YurZ
MNQPKEAGLPEKAAAEPITVIEVAELVDQLTADLPAGDDLDPCTQALIALAVRCSVTSLDVEGSREWVDRAIDAGATPAQIHEVFAVIAGLGVHTLFEATRQLAAALDERGMALPAVDSARQDLWDRYVGADHYWDRMNHEIPGFLDSLLRFSPEMFASFFEFCAVPWKSRALRTVTKELISIAADASSTHRYLPGVRLHVANAIALGAGRRAILSTVAIAGQAPEHRGVG